VVAARGSDGVAEAAIAGWHRESGRENWVRALPFL